MVLGLSLEWTGPVLALVTFLTIWGGHVFVRIVHYYFGTRPAPVVFMGGLLLITATTRTSSDLLSAAGGIIGLTLIWDAFELHRQEKRVRLGHAPLNPRVHKEAAGLLAATIAEAEAGGGQEAVCLSCGSNPNTRFLCRRGPFCQIRAWEKLPASDPLEAPEA